MRPNRKLLENSGYVLAHVARQLPPWWHFRLYHHVHKHLLGDPYWCEDAPRPDRWTRVKPHGYEMKLTPSDWMERYTIHTGEFWSGEIYAVMEDMLDAGSCFVDVGANVGFVTLCAARIVGSGGHVFSFEPNVKLVKRLHHMLDHNGITNVTLYPYAAGSQSGEIGFTNGLHHGSNHVVADVADAPAVVPLRRVDDVLEGHLPDGNVLIKLDVEGAEMMALSGMPNLIGRPNTTFIVEMCDEWLRQNGGSAEGIFRMMSNAGYRAFLPHFPALSSKLRMRPVDSLPARPKTYDVLFQRR
ncbi:FkbM family methyltransferase [Rhodopila sp.]|uniref:FkbM family methyltransferase n=1 Tax=Rhodopila sp. TaxID=2480087 RepID=UPI003D0B728A